MLRDLWGKPAIRSDRYYVFHDESIPNKRWLLIGLLFVAARRVDTVREVLQEHREKEGYSGEIHFSELPKSFGGEYGAKARAARRWMRAYEATLKEDVPFSALAVDRRASAYEHKRFSKDYYAYNRFTAMALKAGIAWHLGPLKLDKLHVQFVSDAKDRMTRPDQGMVDNFEQYVPYRAQVDAWLSQAQGKRYPSLSLRIRQEDSSSDDLLQLTDLLLGATQTALSSGASHKTKRELGAMVVRWCHDLRKAPWEQQYGLHRKYNLWAFPDDEGRPYNKLPLQLRVDDGQLSFF